jgi:hypothetical protein
VGDQRGDPDQAARALVQRGGGLCTLVPTHEDRLPFFLAVLPPAAAAAAAVATADTSQVTLAKAWFRTAIARELQAGARQALRQHREDHADADTLTEAIDDAGPTSSSATSTQQLCPSAEASLLGDVQALCRMTRGVLHSLGCTWFEVADDAAPQLPRVYEQLALRERALAPLFTIRRPGVHLAQSDLIRSHLLDHFPCECSKAWAYQHCWRPLEALCASREASAAAAAATGAAPPPAKRRVAPSARSHDAAKNDADTMAALPALDACLLAFVRSHAFVHEEGGYAHPT